MFEKISDFYWIAWLPIAYRAAWLIVFYIVGAALFKGFLWIVSGQRESRRADKAFAEEVFRASEREKAYVNGAVELQREARQHPNYQQLAADHQAAQLQHQQSNLAA